MIPINPEAIGDPNATPVVYLGEAAGEVLGIRQRTEITGDWLAEEPADGTALYWPETRSRFARLAIRDDAAAENIHAEPGQRWWAPNVCEYPCTWAEFVDLIDDTTPLLSAIVMVRSAGDQPEATG